MLPGEAGPRATASTSAPDRGASPQLSRRIVAADFVRNLCEEAKRGIRKRLGQTLSFL